MVVLNVAVQVRLSFKTSVKATNDPSLKPVSQL